MVVAKLGRQGVHLPWWPQVHRSKALKMQVRSCDLDMADTPSVSSLAILMYSRRCDDDRNIGSIQMLAYTQLLNPPKPFPMSWTVHRLLALDGVAIRIDAGHSGEVLVSSMPRPISGSELPFRTTECVSLSQSSSRAVYTQ